MFARTYGSKLTASVVTEHTVDLEAVTTSVRELLGDIPNRERPRASARLSRAVEQLYSMMNWPESTVGHALSRGDLLIWPDRRYLHRALPIDAGRRTRRLRRVVGHWSDARSATSP